MLEEFKANPYPSDDKIHEIAAKFRISKLRVISWFKNEAYRQKAKGANWNQLHRRKGAAESCVEGEEENVEEDEENVEADEENELDAAGRNVEGYEENKLDEAEENEDVDEMVKNALVTYSNENIQEVKVILASTRQTRFDNKGRGKNNEDANNDESACNGTNVEDSEVAYNGTGVNSGGGVDNCDLDTTTDQNLSKFIVEFADKTGCEIETLRNRNLDLEENLSRIQSEMVN
jgi:hypothetical protein